MRVVCGLNLSLQLYCLLFEHFGPETTRWKRDEVYLELGSEGLMFRGMRVIKH